MKQVKINLNDGNVVIGSIWRYSGEITENWQIERSNKELEVHKRGKQIKDYHVCINDLNGYDHTERKFVDIPAEDIESFEFVNDEEVIFINPENGYRLTAYSTMESWEEVVSTVELLKYENDLEDVICNIIVDGYINGVYSGGKWDLIRAGKFIQISKKQIYAK